MSISYEMEMLLREFLEESNRIEGIYKEITTSDLESLREVLEHRLSWDVGAVCDIALRYEPRALLRHRAGMDVRVGYHVPPAGGQFVVDSLRDICDELNRDPRTRTQSCARVHAWFEDIHPFMDGNGRTGRILWLWDIKRCVPRDVYENILRRGFLHNWYYNTLDELRDEQ